MKRFFALGSLVLTVATWLGYALLARPLSVGIAHRWGPEIVRKGDGKFSDAAVFLQHRFYEGALLLTLTLGLVVVAVTLASVLARRIPPLWKWIPYSVIGFVGVNLWIKIGRWHLPLLVPVLERQRNHQQPDPVPHQTAADGREPGAHQSGAGRLQPGPHSNRPPPLEPPARHEHLCHRTPFPRQSQLGFPISRP